MAEKKKPAIRFKGFTEEWEEHKFYNLVLIERGGSPRPIDDYITNEPDGLNWVKIGDAPAQGNYISQTSEKIKPSGLSKTREVQPGDLILSNSMSFGKPYIMTINGCIHDGWLLIRDTQNNFNLKFLCHLLGTTQMLEQYKAFASGSTVNNLNKELVGNTLVTIPRSNEQIKLGAFFESLDQLIIHQQHKYNKLQNIKKSMLEKMFPQNGKNIPEIRFKEFKKVWILKKLDEVAKYRNGKAHENDISERGKYVVVNSKFVSTDGEVCKFTEIQIEALYKNEIAFVLSDVPNGKAIAKTFLVEEDNKYTLNQRIAAITPLKNIYAYYLYILMNRNKYFLQFDDGAKQTNLSLDDVMNFREFYPIEKEQRKIGAFFCNIDHLITLHQRKIEKLQNIKKSCLEKMFV